MAAPSTDALLLVGYIPKIHGVRGEVKVAPETDDPTRFEALDRVYIGAATSTVEAHAIRQVRYQYSKRGVTVLLKLDGIDTPEAAQALCKLKVYADEADLPALDEGEVFLDDLIGFAVQTEDGAPVGTVRDVLELPGHDLYVVAREGQPDAMIPNVPEFIVALDVAAQRITVRPIEGLL